MLVTQSELSWKESRVLWELRCYLDDVGRCALTSTTTLSAILQLTRCCLVFVRFCADAAEMRGKESRRLRAELVVRADHAGVAGR